MKEKFESILNSMSPDEMPTPDLRDIAHELGVPVALRMVKEFGGSVFYIPKIDHFKIQRDGFIKKNYNGHNAREIANACGVSMRYIYKILEQENSQSVGIKVAQESLSFD